MKLLRNLVLVEPIFEAKIESKKNGILLPDYAENVLPWRGIVKSIGPEVKLKEILGKSIIFDRMRADTGNLNKESGHKIKLDNKDFYVLPENLIWAIIK